MQTVRSPAANNRGCRSPTAHGVPATIRKNTPPQALKPVAIKRVVAARQVAPAKVGPFEQIDLVITKSDSASPFLDGLVLPDEAAQGIRGSRAGRWRRLGRAVLGRRFPVMLVPVEIDYFLFQGTVHQGGCAEVQDHAVGLDDPDAPVDRWCAGRPIIWVSVDLRELGRSNNNGSRWA